MAFTIAAEGQTSASQDAEHVDRGRYLSIIGACAACHTPAKHSASESENSMFRSDPNWFRHLNKEKHLSGGVPFILRFGSESHGLVVTPNITPDPETGIGAWTVEQIAEALRTGARPNGRALFRFPPHTFYENLAAGDLFALAAYLKSIPPIKQTIVPSSLPLPTTVGTAQRITGQPPTGRSIYRAEYLMKGLVGCIECHSNHDTNGNLRPFTGGRIGDAFAGGFRLGPDLPLLQTDKGYAAWPFPGYAVLYGGNLTRFGLGGDLSYITAKEIVTSMRSGIATVPDKDGRTRPLAHTMLWQFYASMSDNDAYSIAEYIKALTFERGPLDDQERLYYFGNNAEKAFEFFFGEQPSEKDAEAFGITKPNNPKK